MKKIISAIQPNGVLYIGNYFGGIKQFIELQKNRECLFFVADYHALTSSTDADSLRKNVREIVLDYLALGVDPKKVAIFLQSHEPEHTELMWILSNITPISLLERGHSYKDKINKGITSNTGLFTYPVLMAADILMYDIDRVPVRKDQKQHLEMARDIAIKFNEKYGNVFKLPESLILDTTAIIPGIDGAKMSKSYNNTINIFASKKEMKNKLIAGGYGYGHAKKELLETIFTYFEKARVAREELIKNPQYIDMVLAEGAKKARELEVKKIVGLI